MSSTGALSTPKRIFVIGNEDCVLGLSLVGVSGVAVHSADELREALDRHTHDRSIGLLLITDDVSGWARERIDELKVRNVAPLVVEVPGVSGGGGGTSIRDLVQRAVGINLGGS